MAEKVLTMEDDWGAKGAQATGVCHMQPTSDSARRQHSVGSHCYYEE